VTKPRVMVVRLYDGWFLGPKGGKTNSPAQAVQFRAEDAYRFLSALRQGRARYKYDDALWGASLEQLPKRHTHHPLSEEQFHALLVALQTVRLLAEADRSERSADGYLLQAKHAQEMAVKMRDHAAALRATVKEPT
jgi:hypothetical protein